MRGSSVNVAKGFRPIPLYISRIPSIFLNTCRETAKISLDSHMKEVLITCIVNNIYKDDLKDGKGAIHQILCLYSLSVYTF